MSITVREICDLLEKLAPSYLAESWDNIGLLIGRYEKEVKRIMLALDATPIVIKEAIEKNIDLLITHHPTLFKPVKKINSSTVLGNQILDLIENKIALFTAHTNLDSTEGGTSDLVAKKLGLKDVSILDTKQSLSNDRENSYGCGRIGYLEESKTLHQLAKEVKEKLNLPTVQYVGDGEKEIKKVALCTGSAMEYAKIAIKSGADVYITGDIKYHEAWDTVNEGINLINASHFGTEVLILEKVKNYIEHSAPSVQVLISENQKELFKSL